MRTVFMFPAGERADTVALLDNHLTGQSVSWILVGRLHVDLVDDRTGGLFSDWEPDDVLVLERAVGHRPAWALQVDVSGRVDGTTEVCQLAALLLHHGGVAVDDYSSHPWTLPEITGGAEVDGLRFFDFRH